MENILEEVRKISEDSLINKGQEQKDSYPKLIEKIKQVALTGATKCRIQEPEFGEVSAKLLEQDGFKVEFIAQFPVSISDMINGHPEGMRRVWSVDWEGENDEDNGDIIAK